MQFLKLEILRFSTLAPKEVRTRVTGSCWQKLRKFRMNAAHARNFG